MKYQQHGHFFIDWLNENQKFYSLNTKTNALRFTLYARTIRSLYEMFLKYKKRPTKTENVTKKKSPRSIKKSKFEFESSINTLVWERNPIVVFIAILKYENKKYIKR